MPTVTALLDACVLYPAHLRDLLLSLAAADLFRPKWSNTIHEEWISNVLRNRPDLSRGQLEKTRDIMNERFLDALVLDFESLIPGLTLPDPKDRHVLAAAITSKAENIITFNLKDFPFSILRRYRIASAHPDDFVEYLFGSNEEDAMAAVAAMRDRLRAPRMSSEEFVSAIENAGLPKVGLRLRRRISRI